MAMREGSLLQTVSLFADVTRFVTPTDGHTFVGNLEAAAVFGDIEERAQLIGGGGLGGLRGYAPASLFGRARVLAHGEWRGSLSHRLDANLGHFAMVRAFGLAAFADVGALSSCEGYVDLVEPDNLFASVGMGLRLFYDNFGVQPGMMALDFAVPLVVRPRGCLDLPERLPAGPNFMVYLTFIPPY
jgi:hypothetical protein